MYFSKKIWIDLHSGQLRQTKGGNILCKLCSILGHNPEQITIANSQLSSIELFYNSSSRTKLNLSFLPNMHRFVSRQHSSRFIQSSWICFPFLACHAYFLKSQCPWDVDGWKKIWQLCWLNTNFCALLKGQNEPKMKIFQLAIFEKFWF